jgi:hypothetical protein
LGAPDWDLLKEAYEFNKTYKADVVVCVGDMTDQKTWSKYGRDTDDVGNNEEWALTVKAAQRFAKMFPKMKIIIGNHDIRYFKAANLAGVPSQLIRSLEEAIGIPGWEWYDTSRGPLMLDGVGYIHGDEQSGTAVAKAAMMGHPIVQGHDHQGIITYMQPTQRKTPLWGMSAGCTADLDGPGMRYSKKMLRRAFSCFCTVTHGVPQIYPKGWKAKRKK